MPKTEMNLTILIYFFNPSFCKVTRTALEDQGHTLNSVYLSQNLAGNMLNKTLTAAEQTVVVTFITCSVTNVKFTAAITYFCCLKMELTVTSLQLQPQTATVYTVHNF